MEFNPRRASFNADQLRQLLEAVHPRRVLRDGKGHSHLAQQDVVAHLIRLFGFGGYDQRILEIERLYEEPHIDADTGKPSRTRWDVGYRATVALDVRNEEGLLVCRFEDVNVGDAINLPRGDAHRLALTTAVSTALKRDARHLGDQFGLSLYNKGQTSKLVIATKVGAHLRAEGTGTHADMQAEVPASQSLGTEILTTTSLSNVDDGKPATLIDRDTAEKFATELYGRVQRATDKSILHALYEQTGALPEDLAEHLRAEIVARAHELDNEALDPAALADAVDEAAPRTRHGQGAA